MALTDTFIRQVKPSGRAAGDKYTDGDGMYLLVKASGKYWRMDYRYLEKRNTLSLGVYLVVPLLRALGWTPQRMAVEWNRVDVALFDSLPRHDDTLTVVVEAKKMGNSCLSAKSQAMAYADGKTNCHRLIVTDGMRYGVYTRDGGGQFHLYAYLNLARLIRHYPILECEGAEEALLAMAPEWKEAKIHGSA